MSVVSVNQDMKAGVRSYETSAASGTITRTATLVYRVETSSYAIEGPAILGHSLIPQELDAHPTDTSMLVKSRRLSQRQENGKLWDLYVEYSTDTYTASQTNTTGDPVNDPVDVQWSARKVLVVADKDRDGKAILNSAGDPYDPPLEIERPHALLHITRNELTFSGALALVYIQKVNSAQFFGAAAGTVLCSDIGAVLLNRDGFSFWQVSYEFEYAPEGWQPEVLEAGLRQWESSTFKQCVDDQGQPVTTPVPLDANGAQITAPVDPTQCVFKTWNIYESIDFNGLGF